MSGTLNAGKGRCHGSARLLIQPVQAVIELGASGDVLTKVLNAVHHANRHGSPDDFIAVALPAMRMRRNCMLPGHDIELIGSEASLSGLMDLNGVQSLICRGMLRPLEIEKTFLEPGMVGAAYVRDRVFEKRTEGWLRRNEARATRRGKAWKATDSSTPRNGRVGPRTTLRLDYGKAVIYIRQIIEKMTGDDLIVSTYGFSGQVTGHQAILPVYPDAARKANEAV